MPTSPLSSNQHHLRDLMLVVGNSSLHQYFRLYKKKEEKREERKQEKREEKREEGEQEVDFEKKIQKSGKILVRSAQYFAGLI